MRNMHYDMANAHRPVDLQPRPERSEVSHDIGDWVVIGRRSHADEVVLAVRRTRAKAEAVAHMFCWLLEGYQSITAERFSHDSGGVKLESLSGS